MQTVELSQSTSESVCRLRVDVYASVRNLELLSNFHESFSSCKGIMNLKWQDQTFKTQFVNYHRTPGTTLEFCTLCTQYVFEYIMHISSGPDFKNSFNLNS